MTSVMQDSDVSPAEQKAKASPAFVSVARQLPGAKRDLSNLLLVGEAAAEVEDRTGFSVATHTIRSWMKRGIQAEAGRVKLASVGHNGTRFTTQQAVGEFLDKTGLGSAEAATLLGDELLTFQEAAAEVGKPDFRIREWSITGRAGIVLETVKIGGRRFTTKPALDRFRQRIAESIL